MRQLILDYARRDMAEKRGGGVALEEFDEQRIGELDNDARFVIDIEQALNRLEEFSPRLAEVVSARFFAGYTLEEVAEILDISPRTVSRDLNRALAWLKVGLEQDARA